MKKLLVSMVLSTVLLTGCTFLKNDEGIIKVNDSVITQAEFDDEFDKTVNNSFLKNFGGSANLKKSEDNTMYVLFRDKITNELIIKHLLEAEIAKRGIKVTDEDMKNEMKMIIDKVGSKEELAKLLNQRGISNKEFTKDLRTQIEIKKLVDSVTKIKVTEKDAEKYYNANISQFKHGEQVRASHILVSADTLQIIKDIKSKNKNISNEDLNKKVDEKIATQKAKAEQILLTLKSNPDEFEKIAIKSSDDKASGERGGELGYFTKETMVKEFSNVAFSMKPNTISDKLVQTPYGFHIIKVTDRVVAGTTPFAKVKNEIIFYLETQKQVEVLKNLTSGLMKTAKIEYLNETYKPKPIEPKIIQKNNTKK